MTPARKRRKLKVLVTAGPTREKIDPVRYISNYSTGTFGYEIAKAARELGHEVTLISGPVALDRPKGVRFIGVESALEMRNAVLRAAKNADCVIMAAAVADYRIKAQARSKIKKGKKELKLELVRNPDILKELGKAKGRKILVGFALETEDLERNAGKKLAEKGLDMVVANRLAADSDVFGRCKARVLVLDRFGNRCRLEAVSKAKMAKIILDKVSGFNI